jgi:hypothetical protein
MPAIPKWNYMFRIPGGNPNTLRMDRLAHYMAEFAQLLGTENNPIFTGVKNASIGLTAKVPAKRNTETWKRIQLAKSKPDSKPGRSLARLESMLGEDSFGSAELRDVSNKVIYLFRSKVPTNVQNVTVKQYGEVDGIVTGLIGADDTMHLHIRDVLSRDLTLLVKDEALARNLLGCFRRGQVRLRVHGTWERTEDGWVPATNRCTVEGYEVLDDASASEVLSHIAGLEGNGWKDISDPLATWRDLRGIH